MYDDVSTISNKLLFISSTIYNGEKVLEERHKRNRSLCIVGDISPCIRKHKKEALTYLLSVSNMQMHQF